MKKVWLLALRELNATWRSPLGFIVAAIVPVLVLRQFGIAGPGLAALLSLGVIGWSLFIRWFVARHGLEVNAPVAMALVAGDLALSIAGSFLI